MRVRQVLSSVAAVSLGCLGGVSMAQPAPADGPAPAPVYVPAAQTERATYIGLNASPASGAVARQLRLPPGTGLIVDGVAPDGPAAKAGIQQFDVIEKFDDQLLVNLDQFGALIRMHKPGDEVRLTLFHEGRQSDVKVMLGESDLPRRVAVRPVPAPQGDPRAPNPVPEEKHDSPTDALRGLKIPRVHIRMEGDQLIVEDAKGHRLFKQPLEFDLENGTLPFAVHVHVKKHDPPPDASDAPPPPPTVPDQPNEPPPAPPGR